VAVTPVTDQLTINQPIYLSIHPSNNQSQRSHSTVVEVEERERGED